MDPVVTARVPENVRARGVEVLREIGSSTSELVKPGARALDADQMRELEAFMRDVKVSVPSSWESKPFDQLFDEAMEERYADLR